MSDPATPDAPGAAYYTVVGRRTIYGDFEPVVAVVGNYESITVAADDPRTAKAVAIEMYARLYPRDEFRHPDIDLMERVKEAMRDVRHGPTP